MRVSKQVRCAKFRCKDVVHDGYLVPNLDLAPREVRIVLISESAPSDAADWYYAKGEPLFQATTVQAFQDAGARISSFRDVLGLGVYLTTAVKCRKQAYGIQTATVEECSRLLEKELTLFPDVKAWLLMGDVAIKAVNFIAKRGGEGRVVPAGSTYKIRRQEHRFRGARAFPSYLQAGPSFFIEKSKRRMIAEDIAAALRIAGG